MRFNNDKDLKMAFEESSRSDDLDETYFNKTIYAKQVDFMSLEKYELKFEPYITLAKDCGLSSITIHKSLDTHRFYLANLNMGGHGAVFELRPIKYCHIQDINLLKHLLSNHAYELGRVIERNASYEI